MGSTCKDFLQVGPFFYFQILTDPKSLNYGATGDATPETKAKW